MNVRRLGVLLLLAWAPSFAADPTTTPENTLVAALEREDVTACLDWIDASEDRAVESLISLASIVSPSGQEHERARWLAERMRAIGLEDVSIDATPNVVGRIKGRSGRALVFITTLDDLGTIAELQRAGGPKPRREGDRVVGPATEVQSVNAAMLVAAEALVRSGVTPEHDIVIASVAQEETGLIGMQALFDVWQDRAVGWVDVLGDGEEIVYGAESIHWWKIVAHGSGGHTEQDDLPNVNQAIARAVDQILALPRPGRHEHTYINVGIIQSGEVYNHKPVSGWFSLDLRSMQGDVLRDIEHDVKAVLERVEAETGVRFEMEPTVTMDGGQVPGARESRLVRISIEVSRHLGYEPTVSARGCCNMSVSVARGRLAIGLHGVRGGGRATSEEWASIPAIVRTAKHVALLAAAY
jgi:acetylornithine deacetylase/succinyl-diaminopimelate desuccinylase-like protein